MNHVWEALLNDEIDKEDVEEIIKNEKEEIEVKLTRAILELKELKKEINAENIFLLTKSKDILVAYMEVVNTIDKNKLEEKYD